MDADVHRLLRVVRGGGGALMLLYNGQRGKGHKRLFYWFYPAHVYLLYGASCLVYNVLR